MLRPHTSFVKERRVENLSLPFSKGKNSMTFLFLSTPKSLLFLSTTKSHVFSIRYALMKNQAGYEDGK